MKIAIATDHNGFEKKEEIIRFLQSKKIDVTDITLSNDKNDDYPLYAFKVGELVSKKSGRCWNSFMWFWNWNVNCCK